MAWWSEGTLRFNQSMMTRILTTFESTVNSERVPRVSVCALLRQMCTMSCATRGPHFPPDRCPSSPPMGCSWSTDCCRRSDNIAQWCFQVPAANGEDSAQPHEWRLTPDRSNRRRKWKKRKLLAGTKLRTDYLTLLVKQYHATGTITEPSCIFAGELRLH